MPAANAGGDRPQSGPRRLARPPAPYEPRARWAHGGTWTREDVRLAILDWHACLGRPPLSYEWAASGENGASPRTEGIRRWAAEHPRWPSKTTVLRYFGAWSEALEDAGLPVRRLLFDLPFEDRVLAARELHAEGSDIKVIAAELGVKPRTVSEYLRAGSCRRCGAPFVQSPDGLCRHCAHVRSSWAREEVIDAIVEWHAREGSPPSKERWSPANERWTNEFPRWPSATIVTGLFGRWSDAMVAAGHEPRGRTWSAEEIVLALQRWTEAHGGTPPAYGDWKVAGAGHPGVTVVAARFGSWRGALTAAGLASRHRLWTREEAIAALQGLSRNGSGNGSGGAAAGAGGVPWPSTVKRLFGSREAALEAAGLRSQRSP